MINFSISVENNMYVLTIEKTIYEFEFETLDKLYKFIDEYIDVHHDKL